MKLPCGRRFITRTSSTPLPIPVEGKEPTDVHEIASMILYLLEQVKLPETND